jgi:hypothetical protein
MKFALMSLLLSLFASPSSAGCGADYHIICDTVCAGAKDYYCAWEKLFDVANYTGAFNMACTNPAALCIGLSTDTKCADMKEEHNDYVKGEKYEEQIEVKDRTCPTTTTTGMIASSTMEKTTTTTGTKTVASSTVIMAPVNVCVLLVGVMLGQ